MVTFLNKKIETTPRKRHNDEKGQGCKAGVELRGNARNSITRKELQQMHPRGSRK